MKNVWVCALALGASGCVASKQELTDPVTLAANACATPSSTYVFEYHERSGGTCGVLSDDMINVSSDQTIDGWPADCAERTHEDCTTRRSDCKTQDRGRPCWTTSSITYADDGASVSGLLENDCWQGHAWCVSTYDVVGTRVADASM